MADVEPQVEQVESPDSDTEVTTDATETPVESEGESEEQVDTPDNWWDVKGIKDERAVKRLKSIQPEFQKMSERVKELERSNLTSQEQMTAITNDIRKAIADPEVYRQYRRQMGYETDQTPVQAAEKFTLEGCQTVQDLERNLGSHIENLNKSWDAKLKNELAKQQSLFEQRVGMVAEPVAKERWESAMKRTEDKFGPEFASKKASIVGMITNGPYQELVTKHKMPEDKVLEKIFLAEYPEAAMRAMQQKKASSNTKKQAAVTTKPTQGKGGKKIASGKRGAADSLAWLRENGFSFES